MIAIIEVVFCLLMRYPTEPVGDIRQKFIMLIQNGNNTLIEP